MAGYNEDMLAAMKGQAEFIKKQALFEVIQMVAVCDNFEEFKKAALGKAIEFMREMEAEGTLHKGFTDKVVENSKIKGEL